MHLAALLVFLLLSGTSAQTLDSTDLISALNAAINEIRLARIDTALAAEYQLEQVIVDPGMCAIDREIPSRYQYPENPGGALGKILETSVVKVATGVKVSNLPWADFTTTPPGGFTGEYLTNVWNRISDHYFGDESKITITPVFHPEAATIGSAAMFASLNAGDVDMTELWFNLGGFAFGKPRSEQFGMPCPIFAQTEVVQTHVRDEIDNFDELLDALANDGETKVGVVGSGSFSALQQVFPAQVLLYATNELMISAFLTDPKLIAINLVDVGLEDVTNFTIPVVSSIGGFTRKPLVAPEGVKLVPPDGNCGKGSGSFKLKTARTKQCHPHRRDVRREDSVEEARAHLRSQERLVQRMNGKKAFRDIVGAFGEVFSYNTRMVESRFTESIPIERVVSVDESISEEFDSYWGAFERANAGIEYCSYATFGYGDDQLLMEQEIVVPVNGSIVVL